MPASSAACTVAIAVRVVHLRAVRHPVAVGDLRDFETAVAEISIIDHPTTLVRRQATQGLGVDARCVQPSGVRRRKAPLRLRRSSSIPPRPSTLPRNENAAHVLGDRRPDVGRRRGRSPSPPVRRRRPSPSPRPGSSRASDGRRRSPALARAPGTLPSCSAWVMPSIRRGRRRNCSATIADWAWRPQRHASAERRAAGRCGVPARVRGRPCRSRARGGAARPPERSGCGTPAAATAASRADAAAARRSGR